MRTKYCIFFIHATLSEKLCFQNRNTLRQRHVILENKFFPFFSVRLLSVPCDHSGFSSPPQRPMTSDLEGFSILDFIHFIFSYLNSSERASISRLMLSAKQGNYWYQFYYVWSLSGDWTRDLPHSKPALLPLGYRRGGKHYLRSPFVSLRRLEVASH